MIKIISLNLPLSAALSKKALLCLALLVIQLPCYAAKLAPSRVQVLPTWYSDNLAYLGYFMLILLLLSMLYLLYLQLHLQRLKTQDIYNKQVNNNLAGQALGLRQKTSQLQARLDELKGSNKQLLQQCIIDLDTGIYNRRFVNDYMHKVTKTMLRRLEKMTLTQRIENNATLFFIFIAVDDFDQISDSYGYSTGDTVMLSLAKQIEQQCRQGDVLARWQQGSFLLIGQANNSEATLSLAKRLNTCIARQEIALEAQTLSVTVSTGIGYYPFSVTQPSLFDWQQIVTIAQTASKFSREQANGRWASIQAGKFVLNQQDCSKILLDPLTMASQKMIDLRLETGTDKADLCSEQEKCSHPLVS